MISTIKPARRNEKKHIHNLYELRAELGAFPVFLELSWFWTPGGRHIEFIYLCKTGGEMTYVCMKMRYGKRTAWKTSNNFIFSRDKLLLTKTNEKRNLESHTRIVGQNS